MKKEEKHKILEHHQNLRIQLANLCDRADRGEIDKNAKVIGTAIDVLNKHQETYENALFSPDN